MSAISFAVLLNGTLRANSDKRILAARLFPSPTSLQSISPLLLVPSPGSTMSFGAPFNTETPSNLVDIWMLVCTSFFGLWQYLCYCQGSCYVGKLWQSIKYTEFLKLMCQHISGVYTLTWNDYFTQMSVQMALLSSDHFFLSAMSPCCMRLMSLFCNEQQSEKHARID